MKLFQRDYSVWPFNFTNNNSEVQRDTACPWVLWPSLPISSHIRSRSKDLDSIYFSFTVYGSCCSSLLPVAVPNAMTKRNLERDGFINSYLWVAIHQWGKLNPKEKCCFQTCSLTYTQLTSYIAWDQPACDGTTHSGMGPPTSAVNQDNILQTWPDINLIWAIPYLRFHHLMWL